jgi:hypothetical protein
MYLIISKQFCPINCCLLILNGLKYVFYQLGRDMDRLSAIVRQFCVMISISLVSTSLSSNNIALKYKMESPSTFRQESHTSFT